jgi:hypothetical protein
MPAGLVWLAFKGEPPVKSTPSAPTNPIRLEKSDEV